RTTRTTRSGRLFGWTGVRRNWPRSGPGEASSSGRSATTAAPNAAPEPAVTPLRAAAAGIPPGRRRGAARRMTAGLAGDSIQGSALRMHDHDAIKFHKKGAEIKAAVPARCAALRTVGPSQQGAGSAHGGSQEASFLFG